MSKRQTTVPAGKLDEYQQPVLHSGSGADQIWHIPVVQDGKAVFACADNPSASSRVSSLSVFRRRRNPRMCKICKRRTDGDGYPDDAPWGDQP